VIRRLPERTVENDLRGSVGRTSFPRDRETTTGLLVAATIVATVVGGVLGVEVRSGWPARSPLVILVLGLVTLFGVAAIDFLTRGRPSSQGTGQRRDRVRIPLREGQATPPVCPGRQRRRRVLQRRQRPVSRSRSRSRCPAASGGSVVPRPHDRAAGAAADRGTAPDLETYLETSIVA
jgi:hypothetical protein